MSRNLTIAASVNEALRTALSVDATTICFGLGVPDPRGVFGTTIGLQQEFGAERVFDTPTAENGMTGVAIGAALTGLRPIVTHQRLDFFLLAMDQLVNSAAKWSFMFGGQGRVPITIRLICGRGWGQGPTHSQNLQAWFAHVPGLKVVMPSSADDAKGLLLSSIFDDNPVIFIEHRWIHGRIDHVPEGDHRVPIGRARIVREGTDATIVAMSYMVVEALHALEYLEERGVSCELIDLRTISPLDWDCVFSSVEKTGRLLAVDTGSLTCSISAEVVARVATERFFALRAPPRRLALPDIPTPTSLALTRVYYNRAEDIVREVGCLLGSDLDPECLARRRENPVDTPGDWFRGPF